jgi:tRNA threonylcarbamoyladenosine biosynthesis protein TsaB
MMILGIETSDDFVGVGLADEDGVLVSGASEPEMRNKNLLHEFIRVTLDSVGKTLQDIDGVSVSLGPGSFTGLRVGLATAKGICWSKNIPLAGIPSTEVIVRSLGHPTGKFLAIKDARKHEYYYGGFECDGSNWARIIPDSTGGADDFSEFQKNGFEFVGRRNQLEKSGFSIQNLVEYDPDDLGGIVAFLGREKFAEGDTMDVSSSSPEYLRNPGIVESRR